MDDQLRTLALKVVAEVGTTGPGGILPALKALREADGRARSLRHYKEAVEWAVAERAPVTHLAVPEVPAGLDARPVVRFTVHCSHCGTPAPGYEDDGPCLWAVDDLPKLGGYHLDDRDWKVNDGLADPEFGGRALVCPECWTVGWCEYCDGAIHAWEPRGSGRPGEDWHTLCRDNQEEAPRG